MIVSVLMGSVCALDAYPCLYSYLCYLPICAYVSISVYVPICVYVLICVYVTIYVYGFFLGLPSPLYLLFLPVSMVHILVHVSIFIYAPNYVIGV